jgi:hypothetical protein
LRRIGHRDSFAVEFALNENHGGKWLFGKFCYWIGGVQVGNYDSGTSLQDVFLQMRYVVADCAKRNGGPLCTLEPAEVFSKLDASLYGVSDYQVEEEFQSIESPAWFNITIPVDVFDGWKVYLIECDRNALFLFKRLEENRVQTFSVAIGVFDRVIREIYESLEQLYENAVSSSERPPADR